MSANHRADARLSSAGTMVWFKVMAMVSSRIELRGAPSPFPLPTAERVAKGWRGAAEPYPELSEGVEVALSGIWRWDGRGEEAAPDRISSGPVRARDRRYAATLRPPAIAAARRRQLFQILRRRVVAGIDRRGEEFLRVVGPELADLGIAVDDGVDETAVLFLDLADVDREDRIAVLVERHRAERRFLELDRAQRLHEGRLVLDLAARGLERLLEEEAGKIGPHAVIAGVGAIGLAEGCHELLVVRRVDRGAVPAGRDHPHRLVAHALQHALIDRGHAGEHRDLSLEAVFLVLLQEAQAVGAGEPGIDAVDVALDLGDERAVVGGVQGRPQLLHDLAAGILEGALEARCALLAIGEVVGDHRHALHVQLFGGIVAERMIGLRRGRHGA